MKRIIGLDFDETLFYTTTCLLKQFEANTGFHADFDLIQNWDFSPAVPPELLSELFAARTPEVFNKAQPMPGAVFAARRLHKAGHSLYCISSDTEEFFEVKQRLLGLYFPMVQRLILASDKWEAVPGMDILVDDAPHNYPSRMVPQPWNSSNNGVPWQERHFEFWQELPHLC